MNEILLTAFGVVFTVLLTILTTSTRSNGTKLDKFAEATDKRCTQIETDAATDRGIIFGRQGAPGQLAQFDKRIRRLEECAE